MNKTIEPHFKKKSLIWSIWKMLFFFFCLVPYSTSINQCEIGSEKYSVFPSHQARNISIYKDMITTWLKWIILLFNPCPAPKTEQLKKSDEKTCKKNLTNHPNAAVSTWWTKIQERLNARRCILFRREGNECTLLFMFCLWVGETDYCSLGHAGTTYNQVIGKWRWRSTAWKLLFYHCPCACSYSW